MKRIFILSIVLFSCISSKCQETNNRLLFRAEIISNNGDSLDIKTVLTNKSEDTILYLSMSCGWTNFYIIDLDVLWYRNLRCNSNIPISEKIFPHGSRERILKVKIKNKAKFIENKNFRVAFAFVEVKKDHDFSYIDSLFHQYLDSRIGNLIWSNNMEAK